MDLLWRGCHCSSGLVSDLELYIIRTCTYICMYVCVYVCMYEHMVATGHFPCISLRWPTKVSSRTHSNVQVANQLHTEIIKWPNLIFALSCVELSSNIELYIRVIFVIWDSQFLFFLNEVLGQSVVLSCQRTARLLDDNTTHNRGKNNRWPHWPFSMHAYMYVSLRWPNQNVEQDTFKYTYTSGMHAWPIKI